MVLEVWLLYKVWQCWRGENLATIFLDKNMTAHHVKQTTFETTWQFQEHKQCAWPSIPIQRRDYDNWKRTRLEVGDASWVPQGHINLHQHELSSYLINFVTEVVRTHAHLTVCTCTHDTSLPSPFMEQWGTTRWRPHHHHHHPHYPLYLDCKSPSLPLWMCPCLSHVCLVELSHSCLVGSLRGSSFFIIRFSFHLKFIIQY